MTSRLSLAKKTIAMALAAVVLASISALAICSQQAEAEENYAFAVYSAPYPGAPATLVKGYTADDMAQLVKSDRDAVNTLFFKSGAMRVRSTTSYVTVDEMLADAGVTFDNSATLSIADSTGFTASFSYSTYNDNQYFYPNASATDSANKEGAVSGCKMVLAAAFGQSDTSDSTTAADAAAAAVASQTPVDTLYQLMVPQNAAFNIPGRPNVSGACTITVSSAFGRIGGETRIDTMANVVNAGFDHSESVYAKRIMVCTADNFPDALAASGFAGLDYDKGKYTRATPIVTNWNKTLDKQAADEIAMLLENTDKCPNATDKDAQVEIVFVGGTEAISSTVESQVKALAADKNVKFSRIYGNSRTETALALFNYGSSTDTWGNTAIVAAGANYADALSASSLAYAKKMPIFLADNSGNVEDFVLQALSDAKDAGTISNVIIVGGNAAVSDKAQSDLEQVFSSSEVTRLFGDSREETSSAIADYAVDQCGMSYQTVTVASAYSFADALAAAPLAAINNSTMLLVNSDAQAVNPCIVDNIAGAANDIETGFVIGGNAAVSDAIYDQIRGIIFG